MSGSREGGCLCGQVRYETIWPPAQTIACHCSHCRKQTGSALSTIAVVPRDGVIITGELRTYEDRGESAGPVLRKFCSTCGSPLVTEIPAMPDMLFIKSGTLDDTSGAAPAAHLWTSSAQQWFAFPEGAVKVERQ